MNSVPSVTKQPAGGAVPRYTVVGAIASRVRASIGTLNVQLVDKNMGGDEDLADTKTAVDGTYAFKDLDLAAALKRHRKTNPDFQVRVLSGKKLIPTAQQHTAR